ncbi:MAG TPA: class I tRNA ligase family protein, partial [Polyangiaceae bacterium]
IEGVRRFLDRVFAVLTGTVTDDGAAYELETKRVVHKTIKKVTEDIENLRFNTAISAMMILIKHLGALPAVPREAAKTMALLVSPFAPHLGEEMWHRLGAKNTVAYEAWPTFDAELVKDDVVEMGVQVNGKLRGTVQLPVGAAEDVARAEAMKDPKIAANVEGKTLKKVIYVPGKILNFIVG